MTRGQKAAETRKRNAESLARIQAAQAATARIVTTGKCPLCGSKLKRNLSIAGWWQCEQRGAVGFRARANDAPCEWQGFTE